MDPNHYTQGPYDRTGALNIQVCPFCQKRCDIRALVCPHCTHPIPAEFRILGDTSPEEFDREVFANFLKFVPLMLVVTLWVATFFVEVLFGYTPNDYTEFTALQKLLQVVTADTRWILEYATLLVLVPKLAGDLGRMIFGWRPITLAAPMAAACLFAVCKHSTWVRDVDTGWAILLGFLTWLVVRAVSNKPAPMAQAPAGSGIQPDPLRSNRDSKE